jgi:hypothetical protein
MSLEKNNDQLEKLRIPEVSKRTSDLLDAVEQASPEMPASLTSIERDWGDILEQQLLQTDRLYQRHEEIFQDQYRADIAGLHAVDHNAVMNLTTDVLMNVMQTGALHRAAFLGLNILQIAEAGALLAHDPQAIQIESTQAESIESELAEKCSNLANTLFEDRIANRLRGDIHLLPVARLTYPGFLLDMHLRFWRQQSARKVSPEIFQKMQTVFLKSPTKSLKYDSHTMKGRPGAEVSRRNYINSMHAFRESLSTGRAAAPYSLKGNMHDGAKFTFEALDTFLRHGYDPEYCLQLVVKNSNRLGRLTERTEAGLPKVENQTWSLEGDEYPALVMDYPVSTYIPEPAFADKTLATLHRRSCIGGICPVRSPVRLPRDGRVHKNIQRLSDSIQARIDVRPTLLIEQEGMIYLDPAALCFNYILFVIANN